MPPSPIDLTNVAAANYYCGITPNANGSIGNANSNAAIQRIITSASNYFLWRTSRADQSGDVPAASPFNQLVAYTDTYDGNGSNTLPLINWPIRSVQSLVIDNIAIPAAAGYGTPGYVIKANGKSLVIPYGWGSSSPMTFQRAFGWGGYGGGLNNLVKTGPFVRGAQNVVVAYMAGFASVPVVNEAGQVPTAPGPYQYATQQVWISNTSVYYSGGAMLAPVMGTPAVGQYSVANGIYQFNAADAGSNLLFTYTAAGTPADIVDKVSMLVGINYKRVGWADQSSRVMANGAGSTFYRSWKTFPQFEELVDYYMRRSN